MTIRDLLTIIFCWFLMKMDIGVELGCIFGIINQMLIIGLEKEKIVQQLVRQY